MIGLALIFIFILIFFYQKYIHKRYKNLEEEKQNKINIKLLYIFLIFLPFFDVSQAYLRIGLEIITEETIEITNAAKKFKEDKKILEELKYYSINSSIEYIKKEKYSYNVGIDKNNNYYINFNCLNITDKEKEELVFIENEIKNKYKNIKIFKTSTEKIDNKYYNSCTKELLMIGNSYLKQDNVNKRTYSVAYNTMLFFPLEALYNPRYSVSFYNYTLEDFLFGNNYFNIKYFIIIYSLFVLFCFSLCIVKIKYIIKTIYITMILIFLPFLFSIIIEYINSDNKKEELKKDIIYETKYKKELVKYNKIYEYSNDKIVYFDKIYANYDYIYENYNKKNIITLYEDLERIHIKEDNYIIEYILYKTWPEQENIIKKINGIYKKNYSLESLYGFYDFYVQEEFKLKK